MRVTTPIGTRFALSLAVPPLLLGALSLLTACGTSIDQPTPSAGVAIGAAAADAAGVPAPATVADGTKLDEGAAIMAEVAYKGWRIAVEAGIDAGWVKGSLATRLAAYDNAAYSATLAVQAAYRSGNAASYAAAVKEAHAAYDAAMVALKRGKPIQ
jgi:hypothetical protein